MALKDNLNKPENTKVERMGVFELVVLMMNYVGVFAFAVSGALKGIDKNMDIFGCAFLGLATAFGGGIIRDIIAGVQRT
jgi:uncharacterized membrane protein YeiH